MLQLPVFQLVGPFHLETVQAFKVQFLPLDTPPELRVLNDEETFTTG